MVTCSGEVILSKCLCFERLSTLNSFPFMIDPFFQKGMSVQECKQTITKVGFLVTDGEKTSLNPCPAEYIKIPHPF